MREFTLQLKMPDKTREKEKYEEVEAFLSSLAARLHGRTIRIDNLEKELRFLLTFLRDIALMGCDEHDEFQKLLPEFEAVANEVKSLLDSLCIDEDLVAVLNHTDLITVKISIFLNLLPSIRTSVCLTPKFSALDSLPFVDSLTHDLENMMKREDNLVGEEVKDQIEVLYKGLILFKSSIKNIASLQHSEIRELKQPLQRIGQMAHEAEFLLISFSVGGAPLWYLSNRLTDICHEILLIGTELPQITEKYDSGDLEVARNNFNSPPLLPAKRDTAVDEVTVGLEDKAAEVLDKLVGGAERLQVISIIGMPGVGKTTLVNKLFNNSYVNYKFDKLSWCVVSQTYLRQSILADILMQMERATAKDMILKMEEEKLAECIFRTLKGRRYLIVMDDVWGCDVWYDFRRCFPDDGNGSRILFTSRNKGAAPPYSIVYAMPSLSNDQCWELLEKVVFDDERCPPQLLAIGKNIAANCCGLPLAVVVIAGILSTMEREKCTWEQVGGSLASYISDGGGYSVMQILELSYMHLPLHLKPCFLYLGTFKEDKVILARKLMRLWIAEGFISKEIEKHAEDVAEEYLMELIDKSLVMVAKRRSDGGVKTCTVHDLLRDFCLKRCKEENFIAFEENSLSGYEEGSRLRVVGGCISRRDCQHVHSIHGRISLPSDFEAGDLRLLKVLNFDYHRLVPRHRGIEYLVNLRYLIIGEGMDGTSYSAISLLLESIWGLVKLEHLLVNTKWRVSLPPAILKMGKLRFLQVNCEARYDEDCNQTCTQTTNLKFLSRLVIGDRKDEEMLRCSPHLRKLKCVSPKSLKERMEYRHFDLSFLTQLESLNVVFNVHQMKGIIYPANLKKLTLADAVLTRKKISMIGRLENLVVLKLRGCIFAGAGEDWDTRDGEFQKLRFLKLQDMRYLNRWNVASSQHFPRLERLFLYFCSHLRNIPSEIGEIATLQLIEVSGRCPQSLVKSAKEIQQQQMEMGNQQLRIIITNV
ncbi:hypothetical protein C2S52_004859 [Perilla frutescens var. hirtella]|nr:hypothetical protein C2S52_004859 [Perilla frutescens var. hirtella]